MTDSAAEARRLLGLLADEVERLERERDAAYLDAQNADQIAANVWREEYDKMKARAEAAEKRLADDSNLG